MKNFTLSEGSKRTAVLINRSFMELEIVECLERGEREKKRRIEDHKKQNPGDTRTRIRNPDNDGEYGTDKN